MVTFNEGDKFAVGDKVYKIVGGAIVRKGNLFLEVEPERCLRVVCKYFEVPYEDIDKCCRKHNIAMARRTFCYIMRNYSSLTVDKIGSYIKRHHSSVLYHCNEFEAMIKFNRDKREIYGKIMADLGLVDKVVKE